MYVSARNRLVIVLTNISISSWRYKKKLLCRSENSKYFNDTSLIYFVALLCFMIIKMTELYWLFYVYTLGYLYYVYDFSSMFSK